MTVRNPLALSNISAEDFRLGQMAFSTPLGTFPARSGVRPGPQGVDSLAVTASNPAVMSVQVASGQCFVTGTITSTQGTYVCTNDAPVTLAIAAADPTNPRIDSIVMQVQDPAYQGSVTGASLVVITGTPAATPAAPALPASSLLLANVAVAANATSITSTNITDERTYTAALGGSIVGPSAARVAIVSPATGQSWFESDTGYAYDWTGSVWRARPLGMLAYSAPSGPPSGSSDYFTSSATTFAGATDQLSLSFSTQANRLCRARFYAGSAQTGGTANNAGSAFMGGIGLDGSEIASAVGETAFNAADDVELIVERLWSPPAGSHTLTARVWVPSGAAATSVSVTNANSIGGFAYTFLTIEDLGSK